MMQAQGEVLPLRLGGAEPLLCSAATPWAGVQFEVHRLSTNEDVGESGPVDGEHGLMIVTSGQYETFVRGRAGDLSFRSGPGAVRILSGNARPHVLRIRGRAELLAVRLTPQWLRYLPFDVTKMVRHPPVSGGATICALASALRQEVASGCGTGRLYAESLSLSLLSYALGRVPESEHAARRALSADERESLRRYIHEHLDRNLGVDCLAGVVGLSPRVFSERFREAFGTTPHRYVTGQRLREGARLLASNRYDIGEIALRVGFCSQSHLTAVFRKAYGVTPRAYASGRRTVVT